MSKCPDELFPLLSEQAHTARMLSVEMPTSGQVLGERYQLTGDPGRDGTGAIFEAKDLRLKMTVAVREADPNDEAAHQALQREVRLLTGLRHSSLPFVIDQFTDGGRLYLVTEFVGKESLAERLSRARTPLPLDDVLDWAWHLLDVLEHLHGQPQPLLHGNIHPSGIYVRDEQVFLLNFGVERQEGEPQSARDRLAYVQEQASGFVSLEQIRGLATTPASDLYSLGATLYFLLTGVEPEEAIMRAISESDPLESIDALRPELPGHVAQAVMAALALDSKRRPQSAGDLRSLLFEAPVSAKPRRRYARPLTVTAVLVSLVGAAIAVLYLHPPSCDKIPAYVKQHVAVKCMQIAIAPPPVAPPPAPAEAQRPADDGVAAKARSAELAAEAAERQQRGNYPGAVEAAEAAIQADPENSYAHAVKCDVIWDIKAATAEYATASPSEGMKQLETCAKKIITMVKEPRTAEELAARGWAFATRGKNAAALRDADSALSLKPDLVLARMVRAVVVLDAGPAQGARYQQGVTDLLDVIRLKPDYPQAHYLLASVYTSHDLFSLAAAEAEKAVQLLPQAKSFTRLGDILAEMGQVEKAAEQYQKALDADGKFMLAYRKLGQLYSEQGKWDEVLKFAERGLRVGDDTILRDLLEQANLALGNVEEAEAEVDERQTRPAPEGR